MTPAQANPAHQLGCMQERGPVMGQGQEQGSCSTTGVTCPGHSNKAKLPHKVLLPSKYLGVLPLPLGATVKLLQQHTGGQLLDLVLEVRAGSTITGP